jgi:Cysteine rich repeat
MVAALLVIKIEDLSRCPVNSFTTTKGVTHMKNMTALSGLKMNFPALLAGAFCLSIATFSAAEQGERPCADDAAKLCKGVEQGEGRIAKCLKEHHSELSPACKANVAKAKEEIREMKDACKDDAKKLCKDTKSGGGRIIQCLKQHESELSAQCKEKIEQPRGKR